MSAWRVSAEICDENGKTAKVSFIVESTVGWKWAVEQAHMHLEDQQVTGEVSIDQVWPEASGA